MRIRLGVKKAPTKERQSRGCQLRCPLRAGEAREAFGFGVATLVLLRHLMRAKEVV